VLPGTFFLAVARLLSCLELSFFFRGHPLFGVFSPLEVFLSPSSSRRRSCNFRMSRLLLHRLTSCLQRVVVPPRVLLVGRCLSFTVPFGSLFTSWSALVSQEKDPPPPCSHVWRVFCAPVGLMSSFLGSVFPRGPPPRPNFFTTGELLPQHHIHLLPLTVGTAQRSFRRLEAF